MNSSLSRLLDFSAQLGKRKFIVKRDKSGYELLSFRRGRRFSIQLKDDSTSCLNIDDRLVATGEKNILLQLNKEWNASFS